MRNVIIFFLFCALSLNAQKLKGIVFENIDGVNSPLPGVNIFWEGTSIGTTTDSDGNFEIIKTAADSINLIVAYVSYKPDTINVKKNDSFVEILLTENLELDEVTVSVRRRSTVIDEVSPFALQTMLNKEFKRAACCNLSESFETNASVDVSYTDAVTGAKQIRLLGLDGKYGQIMTENIPNFRGIGSSFGIYYIPGPWMESVQLSKGTASVINGFESTTGQINIEFKKNEGKNYFYADLFSTNNLKSDVNTISSLNLNENLSTTLFLHGEYFGNVVDHNNDGFLDHPNIRQLNVLNKWNYDDYKNWHIAATFNYTVEERYGGQLGFGKSSNKDQYRNIIDNERFQFWSKIGYIFGNKMNTSLGFINMLTSHKQNSMFGNRNYDSDDYNYYMNLIFETELFNAQHKINTGFSLIYDKISETYLNVDFYRKEVVPGAFLQYTFQPLASLTFIGGMRADRSSEFGTFFTPRIHMRYSPMENSTVRLSIGKGYRTSNILAENISFQSTSRAFIIPDNLKMEEALNYGLNLTQYLNLFDKELLINAEFYRTEFVNKIVVDIDQNYREVNFYNLEGSSYANNFQLELSYELIKQLDVMTAIRYSTAKTTINGKLLSDPLNKDYKGLISLSYLTNLRLWQFDFTAQFNGPSRIPELSETAQIEMGKYSPSYAFFMAQVTHFLKGWEVFAGIENITDFVQDKTVISPDDPFGPEFDSSIIWGPLEGRKFYLGIRLSVN